MEKLLLVDGSNLLFQMFFGMPARIINEQGKAIQGTLGFVGALLKIIRRMEPTHVAVLFDGESNVDMKERFLVYGIRELGAELSPLAMLLIIAHIEEKLIKNHKNGIATWLYIDEFHRTRRSAC